MRGFLEKFEVRLTSTCLKQSILCFRSRDTKGELFFLSGWEFRASWKLISCPNKERDYKASVFVHNRAQQYRS